MSSNEVSAKNNLPFLYTWKLERLFLSTPSSGKLWEYSSVFPAGGYMWFKHHPAWKSGVFEIKKKTYLVLLHKIGEKDEKLALNLSKVEVEGGENYLSLFLALLDAASPLPLHIEVVLELSILDKNYSQCSKRKVTHTFRQSKSTEECHPYFISLETLKCPSSGFLVAEIIDVVIHSQENAFLSPKPQKNSCSPAHTWKIDGFSKLTEQYYTSAFLYNDHIWYLQLYPKGVLEEEDKSISVFLANGSSPTPSVNISAEVYIGWVDQINGKNQYRRGPQMIFNKTSSWGWIKFLSFDELREPSKGILVNDTCILNVGFFTYDIAKL